MLLPDSGIPILYAGCSVVTCDMDSCCAQLIETGMVCLVEDKRHVSCMMWLVPYGSFSIRVTGVMIVLWNTAKHWYGYGSGLN